MTAALAVKRGTLELATVKLALPGSFTSLSAVSATHSGKSLAVGHAAESGSISITFSPPITLNADDELTLVIQP